MGIFSRQFTKNSEVRLIDITRKTNSILLEKFSNVKLKYGSFYINTSANSVRINIRENNDTVLVSVDLKPRICFYILCLILFWPAILLGIWKHASTKNQLNDVLDILSFEFGSSK
jgi:hypothetical protein